MPIAGRVALGSAAGAIVAALIAPLIRPLFEVPTGGVGFVTVHQYPKGWDYAVVALLIGLSFVGGMLASRSGWRAGQSTAAGPAAVHSTVWPFTAVVFVLMLFAHDHPYQLMETFHEGEHLTPAFQLREGARPFGEVFFLHGLATDGGLDALVLGDPPSPQRARRLQTILDAIALALLVPIAAEVSATLFGVIAGAFASLCALAAGQLTKTPYFRLLPVLIVTLALLRYVRTGSNRALAVALSVSTLGLLWSLDTGTYALMGTLVVLIIRRPAARALVVSLIIALALPLLLLVVIRADIPQFFLDSFVTIPRSIDAVWSLPAPKSWSGEAARYYVPPVLYGFLLALAARTGDRRRAAQILVLTILSILLFRTASGRVSWAHTRFALPLFGIVAVAFVIEPLVRSRRRVAAGVAIIAAGYLVEVIPNLRLGWDLVGGWNARRDHSHLVPYPFRTGKGIYTVAHDAADLAALNGFIHSLGPDATFFNFSGERALHYLLERQPPVRCPDINLLSSPVLLAEAMGQLRARPPSSVVVKGIEALQTFDGVPHEQRVPELAQWIEQNYPRRFEIGRFTVAVP
ncbi:MAG TPA: hypothetical protein VMS98_13310 [Thermoanaerobaculia bacterium]|nr:hypothetical protein [Thermoanaerobaculia bacterium]